MKILNFAGFVLVSALLACQVGEELEGEGKFSRNATPAQNEIAYKAQQMAECLKRLGDKLGGGLSNYGNDIDALGLEEYASNYGKGVNMRVVADKVLDYAPADLFNHSIVDMGIHGLFPLSIGDGACECMEWRGISLERVPKMDAKGREMKGTSTGEIRFRFHETKGISNNEKDDLINVAGDTNMLSITRILPPSGSESQCELKIVRHFSKGNKDYFQKVETGEGGQFPQSIPTPIPVTYN